MVMNGSIDFGNLYGDVVVGFWQKLFFESLLFYKILLNDEILYWFGWVYLVIVYVINIESIVIGVNGFILCDYFLLVVQEDMFKVMLVKIKQICVIVIFGVVMVFIVVIIQDWLGILWLCDYILEVWFQM